MASLNRCKGVSGGTERKDLLYVRLNFAVFDEPSYFREFFAVRLDRIAQSAHAELFCFFLRGRRECRDQRPTFAQKLPRTLAGVSVDKVKHHIEIGHFLFKALLLVVDGDIGAERAGKLQVFGRDRGEYACASCFRELDRKMTNPTRSAVDQHGLSRREAAMPK